MDGVLEGRGLEKQNRHNKHRFCRPDGFSIPLPAYNARSQNRIESLEKIPKDVDI
jgi:hypothetical protein